MKIAIIGTGRMGRIFGRKLSPTHSIMFGSREASRATALAEEIGHAATGGSIAEAAAFCEVAILAFPWFAFTDVERAVGNALDGKIVIDCINPLRSTGSLAIGHKWSAGEEIAKIWHRAKVVKAFNHIYSTILDNPTFEGQAASMFYCSNDDDAKRVAAQLAQEMGFEPVDAGPIKHARLLEPLAALWMQMAFTMQEGTDFAFHLLRR